MATGNLMTRADNNSSHPSNEGVIDFADMQALARFGHGRLVDSLFLLLTIKDRHEAGQWLKQHKVSSATKEQSPPDTALQIAFSPEGLTAMGLSDDVLQQFSQEFVAGMNGDENRSRRLGDVGSNAPSQWRWGHHDKDCIHIVLLSYAQEGAIDEYVDKLQDVIFDRAFTVIHTLPTDKLTAREPFGFIDGISQPTIDWQQNQRTDVHARSAYSNLLAPGEVVLGYPNEYGQLTRRPRVDPQKCLHASALPLAVDSPQHHDLGLNGSYLVIRQLCQDVDGFWRFVRKKAGADNEYAEYLAASMVGRHRDGKPLISQATEGIAGIDNTDPLNKFNYDNDLHGLQCPVGAHVRRSNPRTADFPPDTTGIVSRLFRMLGFKRSSEYEDLVASSRFHRIVRRGRTFNQNDVQAPQQGLQFICLAGNILRQFEFIQSAWSISSAFAGTREQRDPITGHRQPRRSGAPTDSFMHSDEQQLPHKVVELPQFVTVCGGGYYFMPGLRAIHYLASVACDTGSAELQDADEGVSTTT